MSRRHGTIKLTKRFIILVLLLIWAQPAFPQGSIFFDNHVTGPSTSAVVAPIYGIDPNHPTETKFGNPGTAPTAPIPVGTQTYAGAPLVGSGYTVGLWARVAGSSDPFVLARTVVFRVTTDTSLYGFWLFSVPTIVPNVPSNPSIRAEVMIRVWDSGDGTVNTWDEVIAPQNTLPRGESAPFVVHDQLGDGALVPPPTLVGLQSFQLYLPVPEPSTFALLLAGSVTVFLFRRSRQR